MCLPIIACDHDVTVYCNGEDIRALYFAAGPSDGDSIIFFSKSNVLHRGDDFVTYSFPFIDVNAGGSIDGLINGVEEVIARRSRRTLRSSLDTGRCQLWTTCELT